MVRRTRFDPLHQAASEQQLYQRLPGMARGAPASDSVDVTVDTEAARSARHCGASNSRFAAEAWYAQIAELVRAGHRADEPATLGCPRARRCLPALGERLAALPGIELRGRETAAAADAAGPRGRDRPGEPPALATAPRAHALVARAGSRRAARSRDARDPRRAARTRSTGEPLVSALATATGGASRSRGHEGVSRTALHAHAQDGRVVVRDHSRYGTFVNGERIDGGAKPARATGCASASPGFVFELVAVRVS